MQSIREVSSMNNHERTADAITNDAARTVVDTLSRPDLEAAIARIWADVLGVDEVGLHDNFLLMGGESLLATQVVSEMRSRLGCEVSIRSIFVGTVAEVAAEIAAAASGVRPETCLGASV